MATSALPFNNRYLLDETRRRLSDAYEPVEQPKESFLDRPLPTIRELSEADPVTQYTTNLGNSIREKLLASLAGGINRAKAAPVLASPVHQEAPQELKGPPSDGFVNLPQVGPAPTLAESQAAQKDADPSKPNIMQMLGAGFVSGRQLPPIPFRDDADMTPDTESHVTAVDHATGKTYDYSNGGHKTGHDESQILHGPGPEDTAYGKTYNRLASTLGGNATMMDSSVLPRGSRPSETQDMVTERAVQEFEHPELAIARNPEYQTAALKARLEAAKGTTESRELQQVNTILGTQEQALETARQEALQEATMLKMTPEQALIYTKGKMKNALKEWQMQALTGIAGKKLQ